ncbi:hypothetical protein RhiirA1_543150 [Rhizophagus irregularis]|uniref:Uncharacterized protein n=1 Tax=Rhizophagus irregularis TaxID=588596 RepID=A0A2N0QRA8_9GLOM|nr:hypothetical protein RhiirA1_543150 [Rhizophagus irregularis]GET62934.1 hypothetical protein RIR_jg36465.t1 [Rhizophagus irregularis DAOM 181602=DAOM 197198]
MISAYSCPFLCNTRMAYGNAKSLQPLLVDDVHYILEVIILPNTMIDFNKKELMLANPLLANFMIDFNQKYEKEIMRK